MHIIFLDFDGVIFTGNTPRDEHWPNTLDRPCVARLDELQRTTRAQIVVSSTWRLLHPLSELRRFLSRAGLSCPATVIDATPDIGERSEEISAWLRAHPVQNFVILDDDPIAPQLAAHTVRTTWAHGLTAECVAAALAILA